MPTGSRTPRAPRPGARCPAPSGSELLPALYVDDLGLVVPGRTSGDPTIRGAWCADDRDSTGEATGDPPVRQVPYRWDEKDEPHDIADEAGDDQHHAGRQNRGAVGQLPAGQLAGAHPPA